MATDRNRPVQVRAVAMHGLYTRLDKFQGSALKLPEDRWRMGEAQAAGAPSRRYGPYDHQQAADRHQEMNAGFHAYVPDDTA